MEGQGDAKLSGGRARRVNELQGIALRRREMLWNCVDEQGESTRRKGIALRRMDPLGSSVEKNGFEMEERGEPKKRIAWELNSEATKTKQRIGSASK